MPKNAEGMIEKSPTGIDGLDDITHGGLPCGRVSLLAGGAGSGKTIFGFQTLVNGARAYGEPGVFEVDIASPKGGRPPVRIDDELIDVDYAFLNDADAQSRLSNTQLISQVDPSRYVAVYFVGGKGTLFDFPRNPAVQRLAAAVYDAGGKTGRGNSLWNIPPTLFQDPHAQDAAALQALLDQKQHPITSTGRPHNQSVPAPFPNVATKLTATATANRLPSAGIWLT